MNLPISIISSIISHLLTLKRVEQLWEAHVFICTVPEALVVTLSPGVHLSIFGEGHWELAATAHLYYVQVLQFLHKFGGLTTVAASSAQFTIISIPPRPDLTWRNEYKQELKGEQNQWLDVQTDPFTPFSVTASVCASPLPQATSTTFSPFSAVTSMGVVWSSLEPTTNQ